MDALIYRDRAAAALAAIDTARSYHLTAHATLRGALRAWAFDDAQALAEQAHSRTVAIGAALDAVAGYQAAASFAEALSLLGDSVAPDDLDDWLRDMLEGAGGLVDGYL